MTRRAILVVFGLTLVASSVMLGFPTETVAANKPRKMDSRANRRPIRNPKYDPNAEQVDLFEAVDAGQITVRLIPKDATSGNVLIENKTDTPLTVKIPEAVVGVSVVAQLGNQPGGAQGILGLGNQGAGNAGGGQQALGGGIMQGQGNGQQQGQGQPFNIQGANQLPGNGLNFFSVPAEAVVSLPFNSVCLEHGKSEPDSQSKYTLAPVSSFSKDPVLEQLLVTVAQRKVNTKVAQAAAWHLSNQLSFKDLAEKTDNPLGVLLPLPYFSNEQIQGAKQLVCQVTERANEKLAAQKTDVDSTVDNTTATPRSGRVAAR